MIKIRPYEESDTQAVGQLIEDTYSEFNLSFLPAGERGPYLGPFMHSRSLDDGHRQEIARTIRADVVLVAENDGSIVGVLRGKKDRLHSLFVAADYHRQGIGRQLVEQFEDLMIGLGCEEITLSASLYAVPFYQRLGYEKSDSVQVGASFQGEGFKTQPMRKRLSQGPANSG